MVPPPACPCKRAVAPGHHSQQRSGFGYNGDSKAGV